jgi:hypothetical protein
MPHEWTNIQIMECNADDGAVVTVFKQSDGAAQRYVLGNGQTVEYNTDGTFTIPETQTNLSLMAF